MESLEVIKRYLGHEFKFDIAFENGLKFYLENLFKDKIIPKMTPNSVYPIDIQSCGQAVITFGEMMTRMPELKETAAKITEWTIKNMMDKKGFFYFRIYKNGRIDKTPYIRWSESWMLRALSFLIDDKENIK